MNIVTIRSFSEEAADLLKEAVSAQWITNNAASWASKANPANPMTMKRLARFKGKLTRMGTASSDASKVAPTASDASRLANRATELRTAARDVPRIAKDFAGGKSHKALISEPQLGTHLRSNLAATKYPAPELQRYRQTYGDRLTPHPLAGKTIPKSPHLRKADEAIMDATEASRVRDIEAYGARQKALRGGV